MDEQQQSGGCSLAQMLVVGGMVVFGIIGWQIGARFGVWQAFAGVLIGAVGAVPLVGCLLLCIALVIAGIERIFGRRD